MGSELLGDLLDNATEAKKAEVKTTEPQQVSGTTAAAPQEAKATTAAQPAAAAATAPAADAKPSLNKLVSESKNPDAERIKKEIDEIRLQRSKLIGKISEFRRKLAYKEKEAIHVDKLLKIEEEKEKNEGKSKNGRIGFLKKMKNKLEFKVSTEASSLSEERALVRKIDEVSKQLNEALARVRLTRKRELVKGDIVQFTAGITETDKEIAAIDMKLDAAYSELRKVLGIGRWQEKQKLHKKRSPAPQQVQEINLEDIVVIKKKAAKPSSE
jgi:uncharacterized coiled-coil DUF342 family protein